MISASVVAYREGDKSLVMPEDMAGQASWWLRPTRSTASFSKGQFSIASAPEDC